MRKAAVVLALLLALLLGLPGGAVSVTNGSILVPTPITSLGATRAHRCPLPNGVIAWIVDVTAGTSFSLTATGDTASLSDFDIHFFSDFQTCEKTATAVTPPYDNGDGNEAGTVPAGATKAIINLWSGVPGATFTFTN